MKLIVATKTGGEAGLQPTVAVPTSVENIIAIPVGAIDSERWREHAFLYALDRLTLGVSEHSEKKWHDEALFEAKVSLRRDGGAVVVELPEDVFHFYLLSMTSHDFSWSPRKNKILMIIGEVHSSRKKRKCLW